MLISPDRLQEIWYRGVPAPGWLRAGAWLYACLRIFAQLPYRLRLRRPKVLDVPVVVVGNLTVGGTGKTPLTIALVEALRARGIAVGVISRGYGRRTEGVRLVDQTSTAAEVGDEPLLIARRTRAPVAVGEDRVAAARRLLGAVPLDLLISDDGLEHLALPRSLEIVVIDGARGFGNQRLLPAGPLRAPLSRLQRVDLRVRNGGEAGPGEYAMQIKVRGIRRQKGGHVEALDSWRGRRAHVVAGTGNPARVFASARAIGIEVIEHPQPDHVDYAAAGIPKFDDGLPCITTEKDAVKLPALEGWFVLEVGAEVDPAVIERVVACVEGSR
jgi:tetraacyldisaccharide 4'-kinase